MSDTFKLNIDGQEIEVPKHYTLMQACEEAGAEIPRFCYHEKLPTAANSRTCLVDAAMGSRPLPQPPPAWPPPGARSRICARCALPCRPLSRTLRWAARP